MSRQYSVERKNLWRMKMRRKNANIQSMMNGKIQFKYMKNVSLIHPFGRFIYSLYLGRYEQHSLDFNHFSIPIDSTIFCINNISIFLQFIQTKGLFLHKAIQKKTQYRLNDTYLEGCLYLSYDIFRFKNTFRNSQPGK